MHGVAPRRSRRCGPPVTTVGATTSRGRASRFGSLPPRTRARPALFIPRRWHASRMRA